MNRPESLERLLKSLSGTAWEFDTDSIQLEIHVDKDPGGGQKKYTGVALEEKLSLPRTTSAGKNVYFWTGKRSKMDFKKCNFAFKDFIHLMRRLAPPRLHPAGRGVSAPTWQRQCHRQAGKPKHRIKVLKESWFWESNEFYHLNFVFRAAWFDAWWPETDTEHAIIVEDDLVGHNCIALQLPVKFVQIAIPVQIVQLVTIPVQIVQICATCDNCNLCVICAIRNVLQLSPDQYQSYEMSIGKSW